MKSSGSGMKGWVLRPKVISIGVLLVLAIVILLQNSQAVSFHILFWRLSASLLMLLPLTLLLGFVVGYVFHALTSKRPPKSGEDAQQ
jgi:uncharacterized integral membrane protein